MTQMNDRFVGWGMDKHKKNKTSLKIEAMRTTQSGMICSQLEDIPWPKRIELLQVIYQRIVNFM